MYHLYLTVSLNVSLNVILCIMLINNKCLRPTHAVRSEFIFNEFPPGADNEKVDLPYV